MSDSLPKTKLYYGKNIDVTFDPARCIHSAECVNNLPQVFDASSRPWILTDNALADEVARVVQLCPTGSLHFIRKDGGQAEEAPERNIVTIVADGPLYVRGLVTVFSSDGSLLQDDTRTALCRCGELMSKPFCDNSHLVTGFEDACQFSNTVLPPFPPPAVPGGGCLKIIARENGSFYLEGQFKIIGTDGKVLFSGSQAFLCRCGRSHNKPFCDATHRNR